MSSSTRITPKRTIVHYKYRLVLELGLDPYEVPEKVTHDYDTWSEVCQGIFTHLGQSMDKSDDSIRHCGKWYVTNHGRGKILQVVDFYEYEFDSDTEREIQQTENESEEITEQNRETENCEISDEEDAQESHELDEAHDADEEESSDEVESLHTLIKNNKRSFGELREKAKKCVDEIISCTIM